VLSLVEEFCPRVEVLRPGVCAIGTRGPARYFGGEDALARKVVEAITRVGVTCQVGVADGLFAARLAAQAAPPGTATVVPPGAARAFLAPQPVSTLDGEKMTGLLPRLGIATLGDLARLPVSEVVNRFGTAGGLAHRLACGLDPRPLAARPPASDLSACLEFDPPEPLAEPVVFAAKALAERMHDGLAGRGLACVRVQVILTGEDGQEHARLWRHDGLLSALAVAERVRWQLAGWQATAAGRPGPGGIALLRLVPDQVVPARGRQLGLWGDAEVSDRVARAAVQVQAMLGHGAVTRPVLAGGRGPAEQVTLVPFGDIPAGTRPADRPWPGQIPAPAPAAVFPQPLPATVTDDTGSPVTVSGRAIMSAPPARLSADGTSWFDVTAWAGPWPVAEQWWRPQDARRRARFQLVTEDGAAWLAAVQDGRWQLEARYG
jgi:protein ImuB